MADKPILFSGPMIKALRAGFKTQTRRIIKPQPPEGVVRHCWYSAPVYGFTKDHDVTGDWHKVRLLAYKGDRLWVRETWSGVHEFRNTPPAERVTYGTPDGPVFRDEIHYWADGNPDFGNWEKPRPGIHMPRWASRLTLLVTDVRVERLQDISDRGAQNDCTAEGVFHCDMKLPSYETWSGDGFRSCEKHMYRTLWNAINGEGSWEANPWVVAYSFEVLRGNIDSIDRRAA